MEALDEGADKRIDRDHAFGIEFAERHMHGPLIRASGAEAIEGQIVALADAHAGVANQRKDVAAEIIAAEELLLQQLILLSGERAWQPFGAPRDVLSADQMREFRKLLCPSQFMQDGAQMNQPVDTRCRGQRRGLGAEARHPAEDVWIAAHLSDRIQGVPVRTRAEAYGEVQPGW